METPCIIPYAPRPLQWRFHQQRTRFCVLLCHRRFGKTVAAVNDLLRRPLSGAGQGRGLGLSAAFRGRDPRHPFP